MIRLNWEQKSRVKVYISRRRIWHYENCFPTKNIQFTSGLCWGQCPYTCWCLPFKTFVKIRQHYCSSNLNIVFLLSFYPENDFLNKFLHRTSYDHRLTKTYFFMYAFSDINAVTSCKTKELVIFTYIYSHRCFTSILQYTRIMTETVAHMQFCASRCWVCIVFTLS